MTLSLKFRRHLEENFTLYRIDCGRASFVDFAGRTNEEKDKWSVKTNAIWADSYTTNRNHLILLFSSSQGLISANSSSKWRHLQQRDKQRKSFRKMSSMPTLSFCLSLSANILKAIFVILDGMDSITIWRGR